MLRIFLLLGSLSAFIAVAAGAFGAHMLRGRLTPDLVSTFETGVRYQLVHAVALLFVGLAAARWPSPAWTWAGCLFLAGTVLFSGSLYALSLTGVRALGAITPIGGALFLAGWLLAVAGAARSVPPL